MKPRQKRMIFAAVAVIAVVAASILITNALRNNIAYSFGPSQVKSGEVKQGKLFRLAGMVKKDSLKRDGLNATFIVTDTANEVMVSYTGILPDLFKEGQGAVSQGKLNAKGQFVAEQVLAKHDETYMSSETLAAMEKGKALSGQQVQKAAASVK